MNDLLKRYRLDMRGSPDIRIELQHGDGQTIITAWSASPSVIDPLWKITATGFDFTIDNDATRQHLDLFGGDIGELQYAS